MSATVNVVDAGIGNVASVVNMFKRIGVSAHLVAHASQVSKSRFLVLPGVGAFDGGMEALKQHGLDDAVRSAAEQGGVVLGICLGMHLLFEGSEEGAVPGLGLIPGTVIRFNLSDSSIKIPHMGWNAVHATRNSTLFSTETEEQRFYFVHSYHAVCKDQRDVTATARHGYDFTCAVERGNVMGVQFHPEKSHRFGMALLRRYVGG